MKLFFYSCRRTDGEPAAPLVKPEPLCGLRDMFFEGESQKGGRREDITTQESYERTGAGQGTTGGHRRGRSKVCRNFRKKNVRLLTGFITRNCTFQVHQHNIGNVDDAFSRFCGDEEETPRHHLLINCGVITVKRSRSMGRHQTLICNTQLG